MIKRSGVEIMNARTQNVATAKETIDILKKKQYTDPNGNVVDISAALDNAIKGSILYDEPLPRQDYEEGLQPTIEVVNETTTQAAVRLSKLGHTNIVALNFASARNVGGGFLAGALAQEEDLCRASGLYACIKSKPQYYNHNILSEGTFYTDDIIYSPNVPFFRSDTGSFLESPYPLSIITCPAPNLSTLKKEGLTHVLKAVLKERSQKILQVAAKHEHQTIILGAWGCGAFGNDPAMVASVFQGMLTKVPAFKHVCFAVYDTREPTVLYDAFKTIFSSI